jgi:hypothetical protein
MRGDEIGWDGMGWDGMGWDGWRWDGDGMVWYGMMGRRRHGIGEEAHKGLEVGMVQHVTRRRALVRSEREQLPN